MANYYLDGTTLNNATAVYDDADLTTCAANGFYSDGISVREQITQGSGCLLLPPQICPTCATPCGGSIAGNGNQGLYLLDLDVGGTATDTGAIIVNLTLHQYLMEQCVLMMVIYIINLVHRV